MDIKFYQTEFGYFSVVCDTEVYNTITSANASYLIPWMTLPMTVAFNLDAYDTVNANMMQRLNDLFAKVYYQLLDNVTTTDQTVEYTFAENRSVRIRYRYYKKPADLTFFSQGVVGDTVAGSTNNCLLYGYGDTQYAGDTRIDNITCPVLVCDDDMQLFKNVRAFVRPNQITYGVEPVTTNARWAAFFADVEPSPPPTADTDDPYNKTNGDDPLPDGADIGLPDEPSTTPLDAGLFALYSPTTGQMRRLADYLWTDFGGTGTDVTQVLSEIVQALKRSISNPLNSMLGLSIVASQGLSKGGDSSVHVGFWDTGVSMTKLTKQYFTVDCGSIHFDPVCGDTFLDYAPYSKFTIFLPYVGMRQLDANDVVNHTISVKYRGDAVSGALSCFILKDGTIIQEYSGNCALNLPLTADSWAQTIAAAVQIATSTAAGVSSGGTAGGMISGAAAVATNPSALSPQVMHSGSLAGSAGHMGSQKPFITREAVRYHSTQNFNSVVGYPAYYYRWLAGCKGYTKCLDVHLHDVSANGTELREIEQLLKQGVII